MKASQRKSTNAERQYSAAQNTDQAKPAKSLSLVWQQQQSEGPKPLAEKDIERCAELGYN